MPFPATLPRANAALVDARGYITREWRDFLTSLAGETNVAALSAALAALTGRVVKLEQDDTGAFIIQGFGSISVAGTPQNGVVQLSLAGDAIDPGAVFVYGTNAAGTKGWYRLYDRLGAPNDGIAKLDSGYVLLGEVSTPDDLPSSGNTGEAYRVIDESPGLYPWDGSAFTLDTTATGVVGFVPDDDLAAVEALAGTGLAARTANDAWATRSIAVNPGELTVSDGDGVSGDPTLGLADVPDAGGGAIRKFDRDAKGRVSGTSAATTDDLPEGATNLYFTDARADARITLQKGQPLGLATLAADAKLQANQLPALAITETFVEADEAGMLALDAQQGDVCVRTDEEKSYILTAEPASTLANWQELLTPTGTGGTVTSVDLSVPAGFFVSGGPVTSSGTLTMVYASGYQGYTSAEASKLSGIEAGAEANTVDSVHGRIGAVVAASGDYTFAQIASTPTTLAGYGITDAATSAQGAKADTAVQPADLAAVATSGDYDDLVDKPVLGTAAAADVGDFATAAQGSAADTAVQPGDLAAVATSGAYSDLSGTPTLGTAAAADVVDFDAAGAASAAQAAAQSYADSKVASSIDDGDTTHSPSGDAVFDALAGKAGLIAPQVIEQLGITAPDASSNAHIYLRDETGDAKGIVFWARPSNAVVIRNIISGVTSGQLALTNTTLNWNSEPVALNKDVVHNTGDENIAGAKTFTGNGPTFAGAATNITGPNPTLQYRSTSGNRRFRTRGLITDASDGNFVIDKWNGSSWSQIWEVPLDSGWTSITPASGWSNYGNSYTNLAYRKIGNVVHLRGVLSGGGTVDAALFTLPAGARPSTKGMYRFAGGTGQDFYIDMAGKCAPASGTATGQVAFDGVSFLTD